MKNIKFMTRLFLFALLISILCGAVAAQADKPEIVSQDPKNVAPARWERYRNSDQKVSVLMPKLPSVIDESNVCVQRNAERYYAYAEQAVYQFAVAWKSKKSAPDYCREKRKFDREAFEDKLAELQKSYAGTLTETTIGQRRAFVLKGEGQIRWLIDDLARDRWVEVAITYRDKSKVDPDAFLKSVVFDSEEGTKVGAGSPAVLGDKLTDDPTQDSLAVAPSSGSEARYGSGAGSGEVRNPSKLDPIVNPLVIPVKPRAAYTDAARQNNVQGIVRLRVVFSSNGSIGSISVVNGLPFGLTEQAIIAARRMAFLPRTVNGVPVTTAKLVEYYFAIY